MAIGDSKSSLWKSNECLKSDCVVSNGVKSNCAGGNTIRTDRPNRYAQVVRMPFRTTALRCTVRRKDAQSVGQSRNGGDVLR